MPPRQYSSTASQMSLQVGVNATDTLLSVNTVIGLPSSVPYTLAIDVDTDTEELVTVTGVSGLSLTVTRGSDGTAATPHNVGASVVHTLSARDLREPQEHIYASTGVHGVTGSVVGTSDSQVLDNKVFQNNAGTDAALKVRPKSGQTGSIVKIQNSAGSSDLATFDATGRLIGPGVTGSGGSTFVAPSSAGNAVTARGVSGQVASIVSVRDAALTEVASIGANGSITTAGSVTAAGNAEIAGNVAATGDVTAKRATITGTSPTEIPLTARGATSQSANLLELKSGSGTVVASVGPNGAATFATVTAANVPKIFTGTLTATIPATTTLSSGTVAFPNSFGSAPVVFLTLKTDATVQTTFRVGTVTAANFTATLRNDRPNEVTVELNWLAIGA